MAQIIKLSIEITQTVVKALNDMEGATSKFAKKWEAQNKQVIDVTKKGIGAAMKLASVGIAAFSGALLKTAIDGATFQEKMSEVSAITGATAEEFKALTEAALKGGRETKFNAEESAQALILLSASGMDVIDTINALDGTLSLAAASGATLEQSASLIAASLKQFNLDASESGRVADVYAKAMAVSVLSIDSLTESMKYAGVTGSSFKRSIEETTAAVAQFVNLGLEGSMAGNAYKMSMLQLTQQTDEGVATLKKLGLTYKEISPETFSFSEILQKLGKNFVSVTDMTVVFGARAGAAMSNVANTQTALRQAAKELGVAFDELPSSITGLEKALNDSEGAAKSMAETMLSNVGGQFAELQSVIDDVKLGLFATFGDSLQTLFEDMQTGIISNKEEIIHFFVAGMEIGKAFFGWLTTAIASGIEQFASISGVIGLITEANEFVYNIFYTTVVGVIELAKTLYRDLLVLAFKGAKELIALIPERFVPDGWVQSINETGKSLDSFKGKTLKEFAGEMKFTLTQFKEGANDVLDTSESLTKFADTLDTEVHNALNKFTIDETKGQVVVKDGIKLTEKAIQIKKVEALAKKILADQGLASIEEAKKALAEGTLSEEEYAAAVKQADDAKKAQIETTKGFVKAVMDQGKAVAQHAKEIAEQEKDRLEAQKKEIEQNAKLREEKLELLKIERERLSTAGKQLALGSVAFGASASALGSANFGSGADTTASLNAILGNFAEGLSKTLEGSIGQGLTINGLNADGGFSFAELGDVLSASLSEVLDNTVGEKGGMARSIVDGIGRAITGALDIAIDFFRYLPEIISFLESIPDMVLEAIPRLIESLPKIIKQALELIPVLLTKSIPALVTMLLTDVIPAIIKALPAIMDSLVKAITIVADIILRELPSILATFYMALAKIYINLPLQIAKALWVLLQDLPRLISDAFKEIINVSQSMTNSTQTALRDIAGALGVKGLGSIAGHGDKERNRQRRLVEAQEIAVAGMDAGSLFFESFLGEMGSKIQGAGTKTLLKEIFESIEGINALKEELGRKDIKEIVELMASLGSVLAEQIPALNEYISAIRDQRDALKDGAESVRAIFESFIPADLKGDFEAAMKTAFTIDPNVVGADKFIEANLAAANAVKAIYEDTVKNINASLEIGLKFVDALYAEKIKDIDKNLSEQLKTIDDNLKIELDDIEKQGKEVEDSMKEHLATQLEGVKNWLNSSSDAVKGWFDLVDGLLKGAMETAKDLESSFVFAQTARDKLLQELAKRQGLLGADTSLNNSGVGAINEAMASGGLIDEKLIQSLMDNAISNQDLSINEFDRLSVIITTALDYNSDLLEKQLETQKQAITKTFNASGLGTAGFDITGFDALNSKTVDQLALQFQAQVAANDFAGAEATLQVLRDEKLLALQVESELRKKAFEEAAIKYFENIALGISDAKEDAERIAKDDRTNAEAQAEIDRTTADVQHKELTAALNAVADKQLQEAAALRDIYLLTIEENLLAQATETNRLLGELIGLRADATVAETRAGMTEEEVASLTTAFGGLRSAAIGTGRFIDQDEMIQVHRGEAVLSRDQLRTLESTRVSRESGGVDLSGVVDALRGLNRGNGDQKLEIVVTSEGDVGQFVAQGIRVLNRSNNLTQRNGQLDVKTVR